MTRRDKLLREVAALGLPGAPISGPNVTEADLLELPEPVQRYLRFMRVVGRPRDDSFSIGYTGRFRRGPRDAWMKCEAWQYNCRTPITRVFHIRIRVGGVAPLIARDTYVAGRGRMLIRLLDLVTVGDATGEELDIGELVTYLNDGIFIAPAMLLVPQVRWSPVDRRSFDVALTDRDRTVTARVLVDDGGAPSDFSTTDRFVADGAHPPRFVRARWTTPIEGWQSVGDRRLWTRGRAVWHLPAGELVYADLAPIADSLVFNQSPVALPGPHERDSIQ